MLLLAVAAPGLAQAPPAESDGLPTRTFDTRADPHFRQVAGAMRGYLRKPYNRRFRGAQHICIVGYLDAGGGRKAEIHWREGNRLIGWNGERDPDNLADSIALSTDKIDLAKDVVATDADINGSTYLVTRAWVGRVLADCAAHGARHVVRR